MLEGFEGCGVGTGTGLRGGLQGQDKDVAVTVRTAEVECVAVRQAQDV